jgi:ppGpp synthetase/RelA/SpoT-type nucleotidyltranferase
MLWIKTGNKWLDEKIVELMNFHGELKTLACMNSPLTTEEVETIERRLKSLNTLLNKVAKRKR